MLDAILTPESMLHPLAAAVLGELLTLWVERYLKEWRWTPLLTLALCIFAQIATAAISELAVTPQNAWRAVWFGFLGASVAVFGREIVLNITGLLNQGPRGTQSGRAFLGHGTYAPDNIYRTR